MLREPERNKAFEAGSVNRGCLLREAGTGMSLGKKKVISKGRECLQRGNGLDKATESS